MAQQEPVRVQIEGLDELKKVVRDFGRAASLLKAAAEEFREAQRAAEKSRRLVALRSKQ